MYVIIFINLSFSESTWPCLGVRSVKGLKWQEKDMYMDYQEGGKKMENKFIQSMASEGPGGWQLNTVWFPKIAECYI